MWYAATAETSKKTEEIGGITLPVKFKCKNCGKIIEKSKDSIELSKITKEKCPKCKRELERLKYSKVFIENKELGTVLEV